uniref:Small auxin up regulated protein n=1 Tax=Kalanchoe fedtschenkoi TaxID=63787 RepID=A0A7N0TDG5_KALFE
MKLAGGFKLRRRLTTLFRRSKIRARSYWRNPKPARLNWFQRARFAVRRALGSPRTGSGYVRVGHDQEKPVSVPKGYLAVYVGRRSNEVNGECEVSRVFVPVIHFNHPLFGELLKEAEAEFGFDHPGGITIPCRISELENVRMRIAGGESWRQGGRRLMTWREDKNFRYV